MDRGEEGLRNRSILPGNAPSNLLPSTSSAVQETTGLPQTSPLLRSSPHDPVTSLISTPNSAALETQPSTQDS